MEIYSDEAQHHGYADGQVPESAQGSGWRVFFIVSGSLCGLPVFILAAQIFGSLGFEQGLKAIVLGGAITGLLGALSAFTGSRARSGLAVLADRAFGTLGARIVKIVVAISLVGWFGVNIGVAGQSAATALKQMSGWQVLPFAIGLPMSIMVAVVTLIGAAGMERLGRVLLPATVCVLVLSVYLVFPDMDRVWATKGTGSLDFASSISAIVGTSIVGIVIQPDYGRFVRRPGHAALGAGLSLGVVYPLIMMASAIATLAQGADDLISAMIMLGIGLPALTILLMGAWIDTCAAQYSASLSFANQMPRLSFYAIVGAIWWAGVTLVWLGAETVFIPFLMTLGLALPPLAAILTLSHFMSSQIADTRGSVLAVVSWITGTLAGLSATKGMLTISSLPVIDSILVTGAVFAVARLTLARNMSGDAETQTL